MKKSTKKSTNARLLRFALQVLLSLTLVGVGASQLAAQEDWGVERGDLKAKKIERYKQIVNRSPEEGYAFKQLMKTVGRGDDYDKLVAEYRKMTEENPSDYNAQMLLGHILRYGNQLDAALTAYQAAAKIDETSLAWESVGMVHEANKSMDDAVEAYEKALKVSDKNDQKERILRSLGTMALHRRHLDEAKVYFERLVELDAKSIFLRKELAQLLVENKLYDDALTHLEAASKLAGNNAQVKTQLMLDIGDVYEKQGKDDEAIALYRQAAKKVAAGNWLQLEVEERIIGIYRRQNNLEKLVEYYLDTWSNPDFDQTMILARLYEEMGDEGVALEYVRKAIKKRPADADARLKLIQLLERNGDLDSVVAAYKDLIKAMPREVRYRFELSDILYRAQKKDEAIKVLVDAGKVFSKDAEVHVHLADKYMSWDLRDDALKEYKLIVKLEPKDPNHLESLGEFYFQLGKRDEALETWKKVLKIVDNEAEAHVTLGRIYADHMMIDEAIVEYKLAVEKAADNLAIYRDLGEVYERARKHNEAIEVWETLLGKSDDKLLRREARQHIIAIYHQQGTLRANLYQYEAKFDREPPDLEAGYFLAESYLKLKDLEAATEILEKILLKKADDVEALLALEKAYTELGDHEKAIAVLERLATVDADRARLYYQQIADAYLRKGDPDSAEVWMVEALRLNANDARSYAKLGDVYRKKGLPEKAAQMYEEAINVDSRAFEHYFSLAETYAQMHREADADKLYRAVVAQAIDESMVLRAARRSIDYNDFVGTLGTLETAFIPLIHKTPRRPVYGRILIELYVTMTQRPIARVRSGVPETRDAARAELEEIGRRAIKPLLDAVTDDEGVMRATALDLLGELRNANATGVLGRLIDDPNRQMQLRATLALGRIVDARAVEALAKASGDNYERPIRELAVWGLGRTESPEAIPVLEGLTRDPKVSIRALAAIGLGRLGAGRDTLISMMDSPDARVRRAAAWALGHVGGKDAAERLRISLREDEDDVAAMAAWSLGALNDEDSIEALFDGYWSSRPAVRQAAGAALSRLTSKDKVPTSIGLWEENASFINLSDAAQPFDVDGLLQELLDNESRAVAGDPSKLVEDHGATLKRLLKRRLKDDRADVVTRVLRDLDGEPQSGFLSASGDHPAMLAMLGELKGELRSLLTADAKAQRWHAASVLGKLADKESVATLIELLSSDPEVDVRRKAAMALGSIGDAQAVPALTAALSDSTFGVRAHAAWALGLMGEKGAYDAVVKLLDDDYSYVVGMAVRALGAMGDPRAIDVLVGRLETAPPSVQAEMVYALDALGRKDALTVLEGSPHPVVFDALRAIRSKTE